MPSVVIVRLFWPDTSINVLCPLLYLKNLSIFTSSSRLGPLPYNFTICPFASPNKALKSNRPMLLLKSTRYWQQSDSSIIFKSNSRSDVIYSECPARITNWIAFLIIFLLLFLASAFLGTMLGAFTDYTEGVGIAGGSPSSPIRSSDSFFPFSFIQLFGVFWRFARFAELFRLPFN